MKTTILTILLALVLIIAGCVAYIDCNDNSYEIETTVAIDRSGSHAYALPAKETIKQAFSDERELWKGYAFNAVSLSDVHLNKVYEARIEPECSYTGNVYQRKKKMEDFTKNVDIAIDQLLSEPMDRPFSSLYIAIVGELNRLAESKAKKKRLVIYSDLMEQSPLFSFYTKKTLAELKANPDSIAGRLNKEAALPALNGIEVYLVYPPMNIEDSEQYRIVSNWYKKILEQQGAKVFIEANLIL